MRALVSWGGTALPARAATSLGGSYLIKVQLWDFGGAGRRENARWALQPRGGRVVPPLSPLLFYFFLDAAASRPGHATCRIQE